MKPHWYVLGTIAFTVYGQIILKWRMSKLGVLPDEFLQKLLFLFKALLDPFVFSGFLSAFIASLFWMAAMTKLELTVAYPFMSLAPAIVFILGVVILHETFTLGKVLGILLIIVGTIVTVKL